MTCRHRSGDPSCSSYRGPQEEIAVLQRQIDEQRRLLKQPDNSQFEILDCFELSRGLILKVKYESCVGCSFEGTKVLVYAGMTTKDALKWRVIDPHFDDKPRGPREAPSPTARLPASKEGWDMAVKLLMHLGEER